MIIKGSDPDIKTLVTRIEDEALDLQPDFQRGEVWSDVKKRKLIDSILRNWHVPPIHVIELDNANQEVLDGQQRLVAIRDFVNNEFPVDGTIEPSHPDLLRLDNHYYRDLPDIVRKRFDRYTIRVLVITEYEPEEPFELFYRLNQPANLTPAEQRNAFFGPARHQVKELAAYMEAVGLDKSFLGFSNSRMAYDDIIAKLCLALERGTLREKITAAALATRYRSRTGFSDTVFNRAKDCLDALRDAFPSRSMSVKWNKATLFSWLSFIARLHRELGGFPSHFLAKFVLEFENSQPDEPLPSFLRVTNSLRRITFEQELRVIYYDRSTSRVADVSSVLARDIALWYFFCKFLPENKISSADVSAVPLFDEIFLSLEFGDDSYGASEFIEEAISVHGWGSPL